MSSVDNFKSAVIRIRDILRGPGVSITGMDSMRHICLYLLSRYMTREKVDSLGVPSGFAWETLIETAQTKNGGVQKSLDCFYHPEEDCLVRHFDRLFGTDKFSFDVKSPQKHKEILEILNAVNLTEVDCEMDTLGWVYEQHLKTGSSAARDLGQFFTDRSVCEYMAELCRPRFKSVGVPESVCDVSMGTGGFLMAFIKYFKKHHADKPIDWAVQQKEIHGCDTDPKVAAVARLNFFMETGGNRSTNLLTHDSLYGDLSQTTYDVILANMPFGIKGIKHAECCERVKALKIRGTKSEPLFLQLMMVSLNQNGRCGVVVPDGMLVNSATLHAHTRKYLLDNFELQRVVKMKGQFFMNTGIQPSILFFEKTGKSTENIEFWELIKNDKGEMIDNLIVTVPRAKIDASYSLDMRRYVESEKDSVNPSGFPMMKLGDITTIETGTYITKKEAVDNGYAIYGGGDACDYYSASSNRNDRLVIAKDGVSLKCVRWVEGYFHLNHHGWTLKCDDTILEKYLYYYLAMKQEDVYAMASGSAQKGINQETMQKFEVVVPPLSVQQEIIATLDRVYSPGTVDLANTLRGMDSILSNPDCIVEAQQLVRKSMQMVSDVKSQMIVDIKSQMIAIMKSVARCGFERKRLSDICDYQNGKTLGSTDKIEGGEYDIMGGGTSYMGKTNRYNREGETITVSKSGTAGFVSYHNKKYWAGDCFTMTPKNSELILRYIYYYLKLNSDLIMSRATGSTIPHCKWQDINDIELPIPPVDFQRNVLSRLESLQSQIDSLHTLQKQSEDNARFILESYLNTPSSTTDV